MADATPRAARGRDPLLVGMLVTLVALKLYVLFTVKGFGPDGAYYADVARQVRDGLGLRAYLSMYHEGFREFPSPTTIYPIWPLLLGYVSRVLPFDAAAFGLPALFWLGALLAGIPLARRLWPHPLFPGVWDVPRAEHLFLLLFGGNELFFEFTSRPYTEGLAWMGLFLMLYRVRAFTGAPSVLRAFELGIWAGVLILVRAQMFLLTLVWIGFFAWMILFSRPTWRSLACAAALAAGWGLAIAPQIAWISTFAEPSFDLLLRFEHYQANDVLEPVRMLEPTGGLLAFLRDRAQGFVVAYKASGRYRYEANFGAAHWAPVLAIPWLARDLRDWIRGGGLRRLVPALRDPSAGWWVYLALLAAGGFLSIHSLHKSYGAEWNFATRHALTVLFLFGAAIVYLGTKGGIARLLAFSLTVITAWMEGHDLSGFVNEVQQEADPAKKYAELTTFLRQEQAKDPGLVIVADSESQRLAQAVPNLPMHWTWSGTPLTVVERMFTELGADYLLAPQELPDTYTADRARFDAEFERVQEGLDGYDVYRFRGAAP